MSLPIDIGIPSNYKTPGTYVKINFGVGPGGADLGTYGILIYGNKTTAGTGTVDTVVYGPNTTPPIQTEQDVITLSGTGSEAHRMWLQVRSVLDIASTLGVTPPPVYMIFPTESVGNQATLDFLVANNSTSSTAYIRFYCGTEFVDTTLTSGMLVDTIGAALVTSINSQTRWPITAGYNAGTDTLTVTAKNRGPRGNEIRCWAVVIGSTATTIANNVSTPLAGGTTEDSWTTALATTASARYYYNISPSTNTAGTNFDDLVTQVIAQAAPTTGIRQVVIAGHVGTQSAASTVAASVNTERCAIAWLQTPELTAGELAAKVGAVRAVFETFDWTWNFDGFGSGIQAGIDTSKFWKVPAQQTRANWPTPGPSGNIETALNNGVTPIGVNQDGSTYIVKSITTRHKNGAVFDYRVTDTTIPNTLDRWTDATVADYNVSYAASKIIDDLNAGEEIPGPRVVQPKQIRALVWRHVDEHANKNLKHAKTIKAGVDVQRDPNNLTRVGVRVPAQVIDLLHQTAFEINDVSTLAS